MSSVIRIVPNGKYVIQLPEDATLERAKAFQNDLENWWNSSETFLILIGMKVVKVGQKSLECPACGTMNDGGNFTCSFCGKNLDD
jgi:hypothetical protein